MFPERPPQGSLFAGNPTFHPPFLLPRQGRGAVGSPALASRGGSGPTRDQAFRSVSLFKKTEIQQHSFY